MVAENVQEKEEDDVYLHCGTETTIGRGKGRNKRPHNEARERREARHFPERAKGFREVRRPNVFQRPSGDEDQCSRFRHCVLGNPVTFGCPWNCDQPRAHGQGI